MLRLQKKKGQVVLNSLLLNYFSIIVPFEPFLFIGKHWVNLRLLEETAFIPHLEETSHSKNVVTFTEEILNGKLHFLCNVV